MSTQYPYTVTFDGRPTPARLGGPSDSLPGLYLDLGEAGEHLVTIGCGEDVIRQLLAENVELRRTLVPIAAQAVGDWFGIATRRQAMLGEWSRSGRTDHTTVRFCPAAGIDLKWSMVGPAVLALQDPQGQAAATEWARDREDAEKWRALQAATVGPGQLVGLAEEPKR